MPDAVTVPQVWARVRYPVVASTGADVQEAVIGGLPGHWRRITHLVGSAAESHPRDPHPCGLEPAQDPRLYITFISWLFGHFRIRRAFNNLFSNELGLSMSFML